MLLATFRSFHDSLYVQETRWYDRWGSIIPIPLAIKICEYEFDKKFKYPLVIQHDPIPLYYEGETTYPLYYIKMDFDKFREWIYRDR